MIILIMLYISFLWLLVFLFGGYAMIDTELRAKKPKPYKRVGPEVKFPVILEEKAGEEENIIKVYDNPTPEPTDKELAKQWIEENADLITALTAPGFKEKQIKIPAKKLEGCTDEVKQEIVLILMEIYAIEICSLGVMPDGSIAGEINN